MFHNDIFLKCKIAESTWYLRKSRRPFGIQSRGRCTPWLEVDIPVLFGESRTTWSSGAWPEFWLNDWWPSTARRDESGKQCNKLQPEKGDKQFSHNWKCFIKKIKFSKVCCQNKFHTFTSHWINTDNVIKSLLKINFESNLSNYNHLKAD